MSEILFYQIPISHFCEKIRWALDHKQIAYRPVCVSPFTRRELAEVSERRQVPVIKDGERVVCESNRIVAYLDERFPDHPLVPRQEPERRECLEIERIADEELGPAVRRLAYGVLLQDRRAMSRLLPPRKGAIKLLNPARRSLIAYALRWHFGITSTRLRADRHGLGRVLEGLQARLGPRDHFIGDSLTIADIAIVSLAGPLEIVSELSDAPEYAGFFAWMRRKRTQHGRREWKR